MGTIYIKIEINPVIIRVSGRPNTPPDGARTVGAKGRLFGLIQPQSLMPVDQTRGDLIYVPEVFDGQIEFNLRQVCGF